MNTETQTTKPKAQIIGADSNVLVLAGICSKALKNAGQANKASEMTSRVFTAESFDQALAIMLEYIEPC